MRVSGRSKVPGEKVQEGENKLVTSSKRGERTRTGCVMGKGVPKSIGT